MNSEKVKLQENRVTRFYEVYLQFLALRTTNNWTASEENSVRTAWLKEEDCLRMLVETNDH